MTSRIRIEPFSLRDTLESGQFFRFTKVTDTYIVQTSGRIFTLFQRGEALFYEGVDEFFLRHFFRLEDDLDAILKTIDRDPVIHRAIRQYKGMRLIRQDPWECLLSFLLSSAKAIPQIRCLIECLCRSCGEKMTWASHIGYHFPEPHCLRASPQLEWVRAGFRTNYLLQANHSMDRDRLIGLKNLPYEEARKRLMGVAGVGKKIADCVLLYSLDFLEAFPLDTWMKKGVRKHYFHGETVGEKEMEIFVRSHFGPSAGYAQLYLYHYWRNHPL